MALMAQRSRCWWMWGLVGAVWLLLASTVAAQAGGAQIIDPDGLLGGQQNAVQEAAQQLAAEGAQVVVVAQRASADDTARNAEQDLGALLQQNNLASSPRQLNPNQIVYYVRLPDTNPDQGFTGVFYGATWRDELDPSFRTINDTITQQASSGNVAGGLAAGINATRTTINPPTSPFVYVLGGVLALTAITLVAAPILRRRRETATALSTARAQAGQMRREAGAAIADLGQRMENARAKAQYDGFSYAPADAQRVQALQRDAEQLFADAQAAFDAAEEQERLAQNPQAGDYERIAGQYGQGRELTQQAAGALSKAEQLRATLDAQRTTNSPPL
jgi:hypothetical protein